MASSSWTRHEIDELKRAISQVSSKVEKQQRWRMIADIVGTRGKKECYEQYKSMKELKKKVQAEAKDENDDLDDLLNEVESNFNITSTTTASSSFTQTQHSMDDEYSDDFDEEDGIDGLLGMLGETSLPKQLHSTHVSVPDAKHQPSSSYSSGGGGGGIRLGRGVLRAEAKSSPTNSGAESKKSVREEKLEGSESKVSSQEEDSMLYVPVDLSTAKPATLHKHELMTIEEANGIRELLFNDVKKVLPDAWKLQGLFFSDQKQLKYGLVQRSGGPCGVLASIQALVLRHLLVQTQSPHNPNPSMLNPSPQQQQTALLLAISDMIMNASVDSNHNHNHSNKSHQVVICIPTGKPHLYRTSTYKPDGVSDDLELVYLNINATTDYDNDDHRRSSSGSVGIAVWLEKHLHHFTDPYGCGALLVLYSVILTRSLKQVRDDMDDGFTGEVRTLLDHHFYMSQEGVNLLLTGKAKSNVFDGERRLEDQISKSKDAVCLGGINKRCSVGFLTLQEAYNYIEVGDYFKNPYFPVWVVYSESHYSVLFGLDQTCINPGNRNGNGRNSLDIYYWDMLANQKEVIKLTVQCEHDEELPDVNDDLALIPPLDLVIRTKWKGCFVDWNGTEEIL